MTDKTYDAATVKKCWDIARFHVGNENCEHRGGIDMETGEVPCALGEEDCICQTEYIATQAVADKIKALPTRSDVGLVDPWSWPCPEGGAHCCCCSDECCDCGYLKNIEPDWQNAETCIENILIQFAGTTSFSEDGPVDTVVSSGDLQVILSLAGAAYFTKNPTATQSDRRDVNNG